MQRFIIPYMIAQRYRYHLPLQHVIFVVIFNYFVFVFQPYSGSIKMSTPAQNFVRFKLNIRLHMWYEIQKIHLSWPRRAVGFKYLTICIYNGEHVFQILYFIQHSPHFFASLSFWH